MIDADKYEGHTKGNWNWGKQGTTDNGDGTIMIRPFTQLESKSGVTLLAIHHGDAKQSDLKLIADAPKLLAEVKRLREQNKLMVDYFRFMRDGGFTDADWRTVSEWIGDEEE